MDDRSLTIGLVAGESSGDLLGAGLIEAIRARREGTRFVGVGGSAMAAAGCELIADYERLAVTGVAEVLAHLPALLRFRGRLRRIFVRAGVDAFVGIDSPDFNLGLERQIKKRGIPTVHYVSPSIWAWRAGRIKTVARAVDRVLTLLPFEKPLYDEHGVDAVFVGHPLVDEIAAVPARDQARRLLDLAPDRKLLALLPGSRRNEIERLAPIFLETANRLASRHPGLEFIAPMANDALAERFIALRDELTPRLDVTVIIRRSREAMAAADAVLLASGTAALEAMLLERPMAVAYRLSAASNAIIRGVLLKIDRVSLPNLLAGRELVPEFLQERARPDLLLPVVDDLLYDDFVRERQRTAFAGLADQLGRDASGHAADAVLGIIERGEVIGNR